MAEYVVMDACECEVIVRRMEREELRGLREELATLSTRTNG